MNVVMVVYNDLNNDARVQRSAATLGKYNNVIVISSGTAPLESDLFKNEVINTAHGYSFVKYIVFTTKVIIKLLSMKYDLLYAHDYYSAYILYKISQLNSRIKYVYDAHELIIPEQLKSQSFRGKVFQYFEKKAINKADLIVCAQEERAELMKEFYSLEKVPLVIRNISILPRESDYKFNKELEGFITNHEKIIVYAGAISRNRNLDELVKVISELGESYGLLIIGYGEYLAELKTNIIRLGVENIYFTGKIPYKQLSNLLIKCDIGYLFYPNEGLNNIHCAPNKIYEYSSVNLPMAANENHTVKKIFNDSGIGVCDNNIKEAIEKITLNYNYYLQNISEFNQKQTWEVEEQKLLKSIQEMF